MRRQPLFVALLIAVATHAQDKPPAAEPIPEKYRTLFESIRATTEARIARHAKEIEQLIEARDNDIRVNEKTKAIPKEIRKAKKKATKPDKSTPKPDVAAKYEEMIDDQRRAIAKLNDEAIRFKMPKLNEPLAVGSMGETQSGFAYVVQVQNDNTALCHLTFYRTQLAPGQGAILAGQPVRENKITDRVLVLLRGVRTSGVADGSPLALPGPVEVTGTHSYTNAAGAKATVFVVEPTDADAMRRYWEAFVAPIKAARKAEQEAADKAAIAKADADAKVKAEAEREKAATDRERAADGKLTLAKQLLKDGSTDKGKAKLREIVRDYAGTKAAVEAERLLLE